MEQLEAQLEGQNILALGRSSGLVRSETVKMGDWAGTSGKATEQSTRAGENRTHE
jgi:hypothetical protein